MERKRFGRHPRKALLSRWGVALLFAWPLWLLAASPAPAFVERGFVLDHNRMIVEVELWRPDGSLRPAKAWVDTGSNTFDFAEALALELGLEFPPFPAGEHSVASPSRAPALSMGGLKLDAEGLKLRVRRGDRVMPGVPAELNLPARVFLNRFVVFDYPARRLTIALPGSVQPRGFPVPCQIHPATGLVQMLVRVGGTPVQMAVDNGSSGTWVSEALARSWAARRPGWRTAQGAAGSANFFGFPFESKGLLLRLPQVRIGGAAARATGALGVPESLFAWYSLKTASPVQGFLGANVLQGFRLEVDFSRPMTYWTEGRANPESFSRVGITLRPLPDGRCMIAGILERAGKPCVRGLEEGDILVQVDDHEVTGLGMGEVMMALEGRPGDWKSLQVDRGGRTLRVRARVARLL